MKRIATGFVLCAVILLSAGWAEAGLVPASASASVSLLGGYGQVVSSDGPNTGTTASATTSLSGFDPLNPSISASGSAQADVSLVPAGGGGGDTWELHSQAQLTSSSSLPSSDVLANATWQDILTLSNTNPNIVGSTIQLNFVSTLQVSGQGAEAIDIATGSNYPPGISYTSTAVVYGGGGNGGWDSLQSLGNGNYLGYWHLDIPISGSNLYYSVSDSSQVYGSGSAADPLQFQSITLPDVGNVTPESLGVSLTFASGIVSPNLASVPEPSSLTLLAIAGMLSIFRVLRHRNAGC